MLRQAASSLARRALQGAQRQYAAAPAISEAGLPEPSLWANSAAVLHGVNDLRFEDFPMSGKVPARNVRIAMKAVGICGSDVHYWQRVRLISVTFLND